MSRLARKFYGLAIAEGEGLGTAYEYLVKYRLIEKIIRNGKSNSVLIAGLPERYGYSLDFVSFSEEHGCFCEIIDERADKLVRLKRILEATKRSGITVCRRELSGLENDYAKERFDLAFSCEVLQRLPYDEQASYIRALRKIAKKVVLFIPNGDNAAHRIYSGLNAISRRDIISQFGVEDVNKHYEIGYVDLPPWPPGEKKSPLKGFIGRAICSISLDILQIISAIESFYPKSVKLKYAHLIYVIM